MTTTGLDDEHKRPDRRTGPTGHLVDGYLAAAAARTPEAVAVVDRGRSWTYGELDGAVNRFASALRSRGIAPGDVVTWMLPNWCEAIVVHLAAIRLGAVSNPVIPIYRHRETAFILRQAASKVLVVPQRFRNFDYPAMIDEIRPEAPALGTVVVVGGDPGRTRFEDLLAEGADTPVEVARASGDVALLLYTSGTTSAPKGALHSHDTLDHENRSIIDFFGLSAADVVFMPSPVGHIIGVLYGLQLPFMLGGPVVLLDVWEPGRALELIEEHRCTFTVAATPFLHGLVHHPSLPERDVSSLRVFACGGADVPPELVRAATTALGCTVGRGYGSTEFPTATACNATDPLARRALTDGRPIGAAEVRLAPDGELQVRGPELFLGYLDASLDAAAFTGDGWLRTGDLARIDDDGYVEIIGRQKDIIIRGGENISAKEIEDHLFEHPAVADAAVVSSPDPVLGERVCAVVVPEPGQDVTLPGIVEWLTARRMARQKLPERLLLLDELPRNPSGKIQKFHLRDLARGQDSPRPDTGWTR
ncbi:MULTISPECIES: AMP-binding protein [Pseudonocardia]|uniref:Short-chain-fatty-acid--CoA ligase n=2 Tax=Pseudonocardia TaxID=1847 RepID=A0A1Y2MSN9_PSEAH|nr:MULTISPECIES: AMP-binding protein [Pseudonocardia]OSY38230.1 Short-chain-fatty-acid--CoA ligase [Pseudonocardia autotrophica]TDN71044.1 cyclohexanecarboxylate-CoA ligase [Pseudonocardia autotrophica]BBG01713.1 cyclohexanecarboxylate-CoA ligase [Pseudonocardia autotrophica]GEC27412.1 cyclohexanecarboxylate-CoA ligase [Pseudonocardia saturnea]